MIWRIYDRFFLAVLLNYGIWRSKNGSRKRTASRCIAEEVFFSEKEWNFVSNRTRAASPKGEWIDVSLFRMARVEGGRYNSQLTCTPKSASDKACPTINNFGSANKENFLSKVTNRNSWLQYAWPSTQIKSRLVLWNKTESLFSKPSKKNRQLKQSFNSNSWS